MDDLTLSTAPSISIPVSKPTNPSLFHKWRNYMEGVPSPDSYINFGFYYLIGCALQRRVWTGAFHEPIFGNQFVIFVGKPGLGKGRVTDPINEILRYHKFKPKLPTAINEEEFEKQHAAKVANGAEIFNKAMAAQGRPDLMTDNTRKSGDRELPLLLPMAADATTYEALVKAISKSLRRKDVPKSEMVPSGIYTHSSICFCLDELSSIFRKHTEDTVNFLLQAYNCKDYEYDTKTQGRDNIKKCCVSILAGTQPDFIANAFKSNMIGTGLLSRFWFIYESSPRANKLLYSPPLTEQQKLDYIAILAWVKQLADIYGYAPLTDEARVYLEEKYLEVNSGKRISPNAKLDEYYARINLHWLKLAMAVHFSYSLDMEINLYDCQTAVAMLEGAEKKMHYALTFDKANPLAKVSGKVLAMLERKGPMTFLEIHFEFWDDCKEMELKEILSALLSFGNIAMKTDSKKETEYVFIAKEKKEEPKD